MLVGSLVNHNSHSFRQFLAGLLAHHVLGVPIWPVRVGLPDALLVLAVRGRGAPKCARQVVRRGKGRRRRVDATGQPLGDFLQQPAVAVGICERNEGAVAEMVGLWAADADADALKPAGGSFSTVKDLACIDALSDELLPRNLDVGDGEEHCLRRTGRGRCEVYAELD
jgi:hypothetical protein